MTINSRQWIMAFAAALATHALAAGLLPQALSSRRYDPPPPKPVLVSLATTPVLPMPAATPPAPVRPTPPVARQPEPKVTPPTPEAAPPQPAPAPIAVKQAPVATPQAPPSTVTAAVNDDNRPPTQEAPSTPTTVAAPTSVLDAVDLAQLRSQYSKTAHHWVNKHKKRYPRRAEYRGDEGTVRLELVVNRHGEVLSYELERSSGHTLLDKEALALIKRSQPLPVFPDELANAKGTITLTITIPFKLR